MCILCCSRNNFFCAALCDSFSCCHSCPACLVCADFPWTSRWLWRNTAMPHLLHVEQFPSLTTLDACLHVLTGYYLINGYIQWKAVDSSLVGFLKNFLKWYFLNFSFFQLLVFLTSLWWQVILFQVDKRSKIKELFFYCFMDKILLINALMGLKALLMQHLPNCRVSFSALTEIKCISIFWQNVKLFL